jgi:hypothetical protein
VAVALTRASRLIPFHPTCLAQATAGQVMLRRRGEPGVVVLGLRRPEIEGDGSASPAWGVHAWLVGTEGALTGGSAASGFTATSAFDARSHR